MLQILRTLFCLSVAIVMVACGSNNQSNAQQALDLSSIAAQRSNAIQLHNDILYTTSPHTNELIAWDSNSKNVIWKKTIGKGAVGVDIDPQDGRLFVAETDEGLVSIHSLDGSLLDTISSVQQPVAVMWVAELQHLFVTDQALNQLIVFNQNFEEKQRISINGAPRGMAFSSATSQILVSTFLSDKFAAVPLSASQSNDTTSLTLGEASYHQVNFKARLAQNILVYKQQVLIPHTQSNNETLNLVFDRVVAPKVSVFHLGDLTLDTSRVIALDTIDRTVNNPIDIAIDTVNGDRWVLNAGTNDISVISDVPTSLVTHIGVAKKPQALWLDSINRRVYTMNTLSYSISEIDMDTRAVINEYPITTQNVSDNIQLGMEVFFLSTDPRAARDRWVSCAICHPDGKQDALVWQQGLGPRNSTSMEGLVSAGQLHWSGDRDEVHDFEHTFQGLMGGSGFLLNPPAELDLTPRTSVSAELDGLSDFLLSLPFPSPLKPQFLDSDAVARGEIVFNRSDTKCTQCHVGPNYTNSAKGTTPPPENNVGTQIRLDDFIKPNAYDTPSLRGLAFSAPYLHDGSAGSLREVFTLHNFNILHGTTSQLSEVEIDDLIEFLRSL